MKPLFAVAGVVLGAVVLFACQDAPDLTEQSAFASVTYRLTVTGLGTGTGKVTSSPAGINCSITLGTAATTGCSFSFAAATTVTLTAAPASGHSFVGWGNFCVGVTKPCKIKMGSSKTVSAEFLKGPFTVRITSASGGSGRIKSQTGLIPAINCLITDGISSGNCAANYPAYTQLTLSATPGTGFVFNGWPDTACGTGSCTSTVIRNKLVPMAFTKIVAGSPASVGKWDPVFTTPVVAVHMHLTPGGQVFLWGDTGDAQLWTASSPTVFTPVTKPFRLYCSGHTILPNGRVFIVGGTSDETRGLRYGTVFNPVSRTFSATTSMAQGRYYPTTTVLPNGDVLVVSGHDTTKTVVTIPEVWNGTSWRRLTTASLSIGQPYYPDMFVAPNGKVFLAGFPQPSRYLDVTGTGQWTTVGNRQVADRTMGSAVMYAPGKILYAGGGDPPTATAEMIDLTQGSPSWQPAASMHSARRQINATILADGTVLVTGGTGGAGFNNQSGVVHTPELWNPATNTWRTMAAEDRNRTYHSTAILLPSARVLSSGSGEGGGISYANAEFSAQVFSPPYLFKPDGTLAARPSISSAPAQVSYGQTFTVATPNAADVTRGNLIRLSSVTHTFNQSQVNFPVAFSQAGSTSITGTAPPSWAPPGTYMLFLVNGAGVPSTAKMVVVGP
jgi:hypothetical protein